MPRTQCFFWGPLRCSCNGFIPVYVSGTPSYLRDYGPNQFVSRSSTSPWRVDTKFRPRRARLEPRKNVGRKSYEKGAKSGYAPAKNEQNSACLKLRRNFTTSNLVGSVWWTWKFGPKKIEKWCPGLSFFLGAFTLFVQRFHPCLRVWYALLSPRFLTKPICFTFLDESLTSPFALNNGFSFRTKSIFKVRLCWIHSISSD